MMLLKDWIAPAVYRRWAFEYRFRLPELPQRPPSFVQSFFGRAILLPLIK
jgi:hypothetical protein